ncbi:MAG: NAD-dependent epimerase/dehydratase family protein [Kineosporiaceae bacterium]
MRVVGHGFMAKHLARIAGDHPDALALAAGVSHPRNPPEAYDRERRLVEETVAGCLREDWKLVFFSSAAVYGGPGCRGREEDVADPPTSYGRHKVALERMIEESGVRHLNIRLAHVVGRHAPAHRLLPSLIRQVETGRVTVHRGTYRDLLHADDAVTVIDALLCAGIDHQVVNLASGRCVLIDRIVRHVERRLGRSAEWIYTDEGTRHCLSVDRLRSLLPPTVQLHYPPDYYEHVIDSYLAVVGRLEYTPACPVGAVSVPAPRPAVC